MNSVDVQRSCVVEIGGIPIGIHADNQEFLERVRQRYGGFLSSARPELELDSVLSRRSLASDDDVHVRRKGSAWLIERGDFEARWDPESGRGEICRNPNPYAFDSVLRILHSLILAYRGGFLVHAASAICGGVSGADVRFNPESETHRRAYVFSGLSGAGKTTLTRLGPANVTVLSDEISYVRPGRDGYAAFGTPFSGELARPGENCSAPVAALFFLEKGPSNRIDEIPGSEAVRRLMRNILFFAEDRKAVEKVFAAACDFVQRVPIRRLTFYPDGRVWEEIRNFEAVAANV
jgi:hypothetical protein